MRVEFEPLSYIGLENDENGMLPCMVLCRAPDDDGWLVIEAGTAIIYNLFDTVAHKYVQWAKGPYSFGTPSHPDLKSVATRSAMLKRARWFHRPAGIETVLAPVSR